MLRLRFPTCSFQCGQQGHKIGQQQIAQDLLIILLQNKMMSSTITRVDIEHKSVISQGLGSRQANPNIIMKVPNSKKSSHNLPLITVPNTNQLPNLFTHSVKVRPLDQFYQSVPDRRKYRDQRESTEVENSTENYCFMPSPPIQRQPQLFQTFSNIGQNDVNTSLGSQIRSGFMKGKQQQHAPMGDNPKEFAEVTNYSCEDLMIQVTHHTNAIRQDYLNMRKKILEQETQLQQLKKIPFDLQKRQKQYQSMQFEWRKQKDIGKYQATKYKVTNKFKSSDDSSTAKKEPRYPDEMLRDSKMSTSVQKHISVQQELKMTQEKLVRIEIQAKKVLEEFISTVQELKDEIQSSKKNEKSQKCLINQLYQIIESKNKELRRYELQKTTSVRAKSANPNEDHMAKSDLLNLFRRIKDKSHVES